MDTLTRLEAFLTPIYAPDAYPALAMQRMTFEKTRPFEGLRILDASPLFRNTLMKYIPLLAGGADLTVGYGSHLPYDPKIAARLTEFGMKYITTDDVPQDFDIILDCAAQFAHFPARLGYVELTRSGEHAYLNTGKSVYVADSGRIKHIETTLGTGDGFQRGMDHFGYSDFTGQNIVVFGCGKVGMGIVLRCLNRGANVFVIDRPETQVPTGVTLIDWQDHTAIDTTLRHAWCAVCATGHKHALVNAFTVEPVLTSDTLLVNMGVEDEFGPAIPIERVLNRNQTLNFALEEPTHLKYIDPTFALHNYGIIKLQQGLSTGLHNPTPEDERPILEAVRTMGSIFSELSNLEVIL